ncbi:MAG: undecaprenyl-diphosphate phosphatase, partial [Acidimicrobiia bacterium]|nr:undecaprenyl-diphosphate phosphatase [Acidimicrobiia bacterium]
MSVLEAILLGILQGLTEFLPISSSGHLQLVTWLADWEPFDGDPSVWTAFEVALHVGTLAGVLAYFGREVVGLAAAGVRQVTGRRSPEGRRAWLLVLATVPAGIVGVAAGSALERNERVWV